MVLDGYKTKIGAFLLAIQGALMVSGIHTPEIEVTITFLGVFLTVFGFRDAMDKKK